MFLPVVALLCNPVKSKPPLAVLGAAPLAVLVVVFVALLLTKTVPSLYTFSTFRVLRTQKICQAFSKVSC